MLFKLYREYLNKYDFEKMPNTLLVFLVETCGKKISMEDLENKRDKVIQFISNQTKSVDTDHEVNWSQVATFVNSTRVKWTKSNLLIALKHINNFDPTREFSSTNFGPIDQENPENYDISMVYALCMEKNIEITTSDTMDTMVDKYNATLHSKQELYENIITKLGNCSKQALINISKHLDYNEVEFEHESKINIHYLVSKSCLHRKEAIVYGFKFFSTDLSTSKDPCKDLLNLSKNITFEPEGNIHPDYYNTDRFWKKEYKDYYNQKSLQNIQEYEACDSESLTEKYEKNNFYLCPLPNIDFEGLGYGIVGNPETFRKVNVEELVNSFKFNNYFKEPFSAKLINYNVVEKLHNICSNMASEEIYRELSNEIYRIKKLCIDNIPDVKEFLEKYLMLSDKIDLFFRELQICCYKTRGWNEGEPFPLTKESIKLPNEESKNSMIKIKQLITDNPYLFKKLPIVKYKNKSFVYTDLYLIDYLDQEKISNNIDFTTVLLYTCYYYNKLCNNKIIFDIDTLEYVS